jgi:hypothetical protein
VIHKTLFELASYGPYRGTVPLWVVTPDGVVHRLFQGAGNMFALCSRYVMEAWMDGQGFEEPEPLTCLSCLGL